MMLRESSKSTNEAVELKDVTTGLSVRTAVAHATILADFAEAVVARDDARIRAAREAVREAMGPAAMVDAAATIAGFHGFVRIADAIGIPYTTAARGQDDPELRAQAGINGFYRVREDAARA
jgi:hypothetical protein